MFANAAQALERLHALKRTALGLNDDSILDDDLPVLQIQDLSRAEIEAMRDDEDDDGVDAVDESEVVTAG
jgi:hypothetical protein